MFGGLLKAVVNTVMLPVDATVDVITLGGLLTDTEARTPRRLEKIVEQTDPDNEDNG